MPPLPRYRRHRNNPQKLPTMTPIEFADPWGELERSGTAQSILTEREIIALQSCDIRLKALGALIGCSAKRAGQIMERAKRKTRHPIRRALVHRLCYYGYLEWHRKERGL